MNALSETELRNLTRLNNEVTQGMREFEEAARKVSIMEEKIAALTSPVSTEGRLARRNAVRMALCSRDDGRTRELIKKFCSEENTDDRLRGEIRLFLHAI